MAHKRGLSSIWPTTIRTWRRNVTASSSRYSSLLERFLRGGTSNQSGDSVHYVGRGLSSVCAREADAALPDAAEREHRHLTKRPNGAQVVLGHYPGTLLVYKRSSTSNRCVVANSHCLLLRVHCLNRYSPIFAQQNDISPLSYVFMPVEVFSNLRHQRFN